MATSATVTVGVSHETASGRVELPVPGVGGAHWIVGGTTGSGKTQFLNAVVASLAQLENTAIVVSDPAFVDYSPWWQERPSCMAVGPDGALPLLDLVEAEMMSRFVAARHLRQRTMAVTAEHPRVVAIFDEVALFSKRKGVDERLARVAAAGRKVNVGLVLATQSPKVSVIPNVAKEQCPVRIGFRCETPEQVDAIFETQRVPADRIPPDLVGVGFIKYRTVTQFRAPLITDEECMAVDADTSRLRPDLGWPRVIDPMMEGDSGASFAGNERGNVGGAGPRAVVDLPGRR